MSLVQQYSKIYLNRFLKNKFWNSSFRKELLGTHYTEPLRAAHSLSFEHIAAYMQLRRLNSPTDFIILLHV